MIVGGFFFSSVVEFDAVRLGKPPSWRVHYFHSTVVYMANAEARILALFQTLPARDQRALVEQLIETARGASFYSRMSAEQRAELDEGISEAERGETVAAEETFNDLAQRFGFSNA